jgi:hypothetical protein
LCLIRAIFVSVWLNWFCRPSFKFVNWSTILSHTFFVFPMFSTLHSILTVHGLSCGPSISSFCEVWHFGNLFSFCFCLYHVWKCIRKFYLFVTVGCFICCTFTIWKFRHFFPPTTYLKIGCYFIPLYLTSIYIQWFLSSSYS